MGAHAPIATWYSEERPQFICCFSGVLSITCLFVDPNCGQVQKQMKSFCRSRDGLADMAGHEARACVIRDDPLTPTSLSWPRARLLILIRSSASAGHCPPMSMP